MLFLCDIHFVYIASLSVIEAVGRVAPSPYQLLHLEEQALNLTWVTQSCKPYGWMCG